MDMFQQAGGRKGEGFSAFQLVLSPLDPSVHPSEHASDLFPNFFIIFFQVSIYLFACWIKRFILIFFNFFLLLLPFHLATSIVWRGKIIDGKWRRCNLPPSVATRHAFIFGFSSPPSLFSSAAVAVIIDPVTMAITNPRIFCFKNFRSNTVKLRVECIAIVVLSWAELNCAVHQLLLAKQLYDSARHDHTESEWERVGGWVDRYHRYISRYKDVCSVLHEPSAISNSSGRWSLTWANLQYSTRLAYS